MHYFIKTRLAATLLTAYVPAAACQIRRGCALLEQPAAWYGSAQARAIADSVIQYQLPLAVWPKNTNIADPPASRDSIPQIEAAGLPNAIDNGATTTLMRFLARMVQASGNAEYAAAFKRGFDYLLTAQYSNGGWPEFFPLRNGYYSHAAYKDGATLKVLTLFRAVGAAELQGESLDHDPRTKAAAAADRGIRWLLRTQVKQDGKLTACCSQDDVKTLLPSWAHAYEPLSISGSETVVIIRFVIRIELRAGYSYLGRWPAALLAEDYPRWRATRTQKYTEIRGDHEVFTRDKH